MSKTLPAECVQSVVSFNGVTIPDAEILSEGNGQSNGIAIIDDDKAYYVTSSATDLKNAIVALNSMITKITNVLSALDGALSGSNAAAIAAIVSENTNFGLTKENLK